MCKKKQSEFELVKILPFMPGSVGNDFSNGILRLNGVTSLSEIDEYVVLQSKKYQTIFDKPLKDSSKFYKLLSIVKVSYIDKEGNKHSIHRAFRSAAANAFIGNYAALTPSSLRLLCAEPGEKVTLEKGCIFPFFLFHPNRTVLCSIWLALIGILVSIVLFLL